MIIQNTYIPQVSLSDVEYVLAKDKNSDRILKVPIDELLGEEIVEIVQFMGKVIPSGLLLCDGKAYKKANFPLLGRVLGNLFNLPGDDDKVVFRVPDLVTGNRFLLSGDGVKYVTADVIGVTGAIAQKYCEDTILNHTHVMYDTVNPNADSGYTTGFHNSQWFNVNYTTANSSSVGIGETAGKNMAVNFCIRTGPVMYDSELERETTDGEIRETTYFETRTLAITS